MRMRMRMVGRMRLGPSRGPVILSSRARLRQIQFATRLSGQFDPQRPAPITACAGGGGTPRARFALRSATNVRSLQAAQCTAHFERCVIPTDGIPAKPSLARRSRPAANPKRERKAQRRQASEGAACTCECSGPRFSPAVAGTPPTATLSTCPPLLARHPPVSRAAGSQAV